MSPRVEHARLNADFNPTERNDTASPERNSDHDPAVAYFTPEPQPSISISDATVTEGDSGAATATFTVTLSRTAAGPVTVDYTTVTGTATAEDFTAVTDTLTIGAGDLTGTIEVTVTGDTKFENDEGFTVVLSNPTGAYLDDDTGAATIVNDDDVPTVSVSDTQVTEGDNPALANVPVTVSLSNASAFPVTATLYSLPMGSAALGIDFLETSTPVTIPAGDLSTVVAFPVLYGDTSVEGDDTFVLDLGGITNAVPGYVRGIATILNDDTAVEAVVWTSKVGVSVAGTTLQ